MNKLAELKNLLEQTEKHFREGKAPTNYDLGFIAGLKEAIRIIESAE